MGCSGYIGSRLCFDFNGAAQIEEVVKIGITDNADILHLDLSEPERFHYDILAGLDYILFLSAVSSPDRCYKNHNESWKINVTGTEYFIRNAIEKGCRILFFSSDAVYGEDKGNVFYEDTETLADTAYGIMKKQIEDTFKKDVFFKTIRLSYVVSKKDRFLSYCLHCMENNGEAAIYHPFYRNCIMLHEVSEAVRWMLLHWNDYPDWVLNVCGSELVSRVEIADSLNRLYDRQIKYRIEDPPGEFFSCRHKITQMNSKYLYHYNILKRTSFVESLRAELER